MVRRAPQPNNQKTFTLMLLVVSVAALYLAADVLIPLALAILLTFILAPLVDRLERLRLGRVPSVLAAVGAAFAVLFAIGWVVAGQMVSLADELPQYQKNIVHKIQAGTGPLSRVGQKIRELNSDIDELGKDLAEGAKKNQDPDSGQAKPDARDAKTPSAPSEAPPEEVEPQPVPVEIVGPGITPFSVLSDVLPGALGWLGTGGIVIVFLIFMLLEREDMRNRLIRLIGADQITVTTQALDDAARRVSRYLRMQLIINASYGLMLAVGLYLIGLPYAVAWGLFAGMLRYLPYVGPWVGASVGILLSLAVFDNWTGPLLTIALFLGAELVVNNVLEPVLYQSSTGVSAIGIIVAAVFWTWLWGPLGLVLSTPLTVCIAVVGRYVPNLEFLNVLLTDESVLPPGTHFYQRLLVSDEDESRELVEEYLHDHTIEKLFANVLLPALVLTEKDGHSGILDETRRHYILENMRDLLEELPDLVAADDSAPAEDAPAVAGGAVVIVPARDTADEIAGHMLQVLLRDRAIESSVLPANVLPGEILEKITALRTPIVVVSAVPPFAIRHARHLSKRLRHRLEGTKILAAVWDESRSETWLETRLQAAGASRVVNCLPHAIQFVERERLNRQPEAVSPGDSI